MRVVQSFWSPNQKLGTCGFKTLQHHLQSWALSSLTIAKFYPNLHLVTDQIGKHILIDTLKLPYKSFSLEFENYQPLMAGEPWTIKKLLAYTTQNEPFIHIDSDVYIWQPFPNHILSAPLVAQNRDCDIKFYKEAYASIVQNFSTVPEYLNGLTKIFGANAGIIGGTDYQFFKSLYNEVTSFLIANKKNLTTVNADYLSTFVEQSMYYYFSSETGRAIQYLFDFTVAAGDDPPLQQFTQLPDQCGYIHLMLSKSNPLMCELLSQRINLDFNEYDEAIKDYLNTLEKYKIVTESNAAADNYPRTSELCKMLSSKFEFTLDQQDAAAIIKDIEQKVTTGISDCLRDVYQFESERSVFVEDFNWQNFKDHSLLVNDTISLGKEWLSQMTIQISTKVALIESEWTWCLRSGQATITTEIDHIIGQSPSYFLTAIIPLHSSNTFYEYQFDASGLMLIDLLSDSMTVTKAYQLMVEQLPNRQQDFEQRFYFYVRFFVYVGILEFKE